MYDERQTELNEAMPECARAIFERSQDARRHDENDLHRWADDGGPAYDEVN